MPGRTWTADSAGGGAAALGDGANPSASGRRSSSDTRQYTRRTVTASIAIGSGILVDANPRDHLSRSTASIAHDIARRFIPPTRAQRVPATPPTAARPIRGRFRLRPPGGHPGSLPAPDAAKPLQPGRFLAALLPRLLEPLPATPAGREPDDRAGRCDERKVRIATPAPGPSDRPIGRQTTWGDLHA